MAVFLGALLIPAAGLGTGNALAQPTTTGGAEVDSAGKGALALFEPVVEGGLHGFFELLDKQPFVFLLLALALGYPLGKVSIRGISLGSTAGTLLAGVAIAVVANLAFDISYSIPGIVATIFMLLFMYALGLRVGPQFFAGLRSGGGAFVLIAVVVWAVNWIIAYGGVKLVGLESGFAAGIIAGSHTVTAVIGVATSALQSGAYTPPEGITTDQIGANIAAGYAISYILSSIGTILLIRYLPAIFGRDPVADATAAEEEMAGGATEPVPGAPGSLTLGFSPLDIRAYRVEHQHIAGKTIEQLFAEHPYAPVLRVVRDGQIIEPADNPTIRRGDVIAVRSDVDTLILGAHEHVGPEVDDPAARNIQLEAADLRVGKKEMAGKTVAALDQSVGFGLQLKALFRQGQQITPIGPHTVIEFGDVARIVGPEWCIRRAANLVGGRPILETGLTEVMHMAIAMAIGYVVGIITVTIGGIPFALGTSAGCLLAGIFASYFRSRNPELGGPVDEGARKFMQDFGLNMFVAVLAANVGPKVIQSFQGTTAIWVAVIGTLAALVPVVMAFAIGFKLLKMNSVVAAGATTGARNNTPGLNAIVAESQSGVVAAAYPVTYAIGAVLALIGGYVAMILS